MHRSLDTMVLTRYLKDRPTLAMLAGAKWDLPMGTRPNMLVGNNHLLTNLKALGSKLRASIGKTETTTTTKGRIMKKPQVAIREDACLSLDEDTTTSMRISTASMVDRQPLKRRMLPYKVHYTNTHNGNQPWDTRLPTFNNNSNSRTRTGTFCSRSSTSDHHIE